MTPDETRIMHCRRCNLHTRHVSNRIVRRPLPLLLLGRVMEVTVWRCSKCGRTQATANRTLPAKRA